MLYSIVRDMNNPQFKRMTRFVSNGSYEIYCKSDSVTVYDKDAGNNPT